ncbi:MAG: putative porin [Bacteroidetes bacterium]|uniref:Porin n=1 Tax=Candidatus Cryptobacteroides intestinavium TaxID=2840766 RepID=A0A9D9HJ25_9BACT|nr:putative porin [Candidatus Cryptobacteroides intestinavium]
MVKLIGKILVPALLVGTAAIQSFGIDAGRAVRFLQDHDSTAFSQGPDSLYISDSMDIMDTTVVSPRDTITVPDSLRETDPLKFRYFIALRDSVTRIQTRDSLMAAKDTIGLMQFDSLYTKDSAEVAQANGSLTKKERRKYDYEQELPKKMAAAMAKLERADSIKAAKDSAIAAKPRILETYAVPDSMQYKRMITWTHDRNFNEVQLFDYDTTYNWHYNDLPIYREDINANHLGPAGSASQLYNFFRREEADNAIFFTPYQIYNYTPENLPMYNTKTPYTELAYWGTLFGKDEKEESNIKILTTQNILPEWNVTLEYHRFGSKGMLLNEDTDNRTFVASTNYMGKRYLMHAGYIYNKVSRTENGGIVDNFWIRDTTVDGKEIAVALNSAHNKIKKNTVFLDQSYRIPFNFIYDIGKGKRKARKAEEARRDSIMATGDSTAIAALLEEEKARESEKMAADSLDRDITSAFIGHSSEYTVYTKNYTDAIDAGDETGRDFYGNRFFINPTNSTDSMRVMRLENRVFLRLQPWKADGIVSKLDVGIGDKLLNYYDYSPSNYLSTRRNTVLNSMYIYAGAQGQYKKYFDWNATGKYTFLGYEVNDFGIDANLTFSAYPFRRDKSSPLLLNAHFETSLKEPDHYQQRLFTNHFRWENDFGKISTTKIEGRLMIPRWNLEAMFGYALLGNNIYYDTDGIVRQNGQAMSVMSAYLRKDFRLWKFHLDHQALFQVSSNPDVLPLPMLALNFRYYLQFDVVKKVMQMQIGANGRYTTRWYAPAYNPVAGVFHNQNEEMYGNCPDIDVFVNIQWKRACIFIKLVNVGLGWPNDQADYFSAHHYILPQRTLKVGIFWPFYIQPGKNARVGGGSGSGGGATGGTGGMTSQRQSIN